MMMISKKSRENYKKCKQLFGGAVKEPVTTSFPTISMRRDTNKEKAAQLSESDTKECKDTVKDFFTMKASVTSLHSNKISKKVALEAGMQALVRTDDCFIKTAAIDLIGVILKQEMEISDFVRFVGSYLVSTSSLKEYLNRYFLKTRRCHIGIVLSPVSPGVEEPTTNVNNTKKMLPAIIRSSDDLTPNTDNTKKAIPGIIVGSDDNIGVVDIQAHEAQSLPEHTKYLTDAKFIWLLVAILVSNAMFTYVLFRLLGNH